MWDRLTNQLTWCLFVAPHKAAPWTVSFFITMIILILSLWTVHYDLLGITGLLFRVVAIVGLIRVLRFEIQIQAEPMLIGIASGRYFGGPLEMPSEELCGCQFCKHLSESGLYADRPAAVESLLYLRVMDDPGFALVGVRLYLERRLRRLAQLNRTGRNARGIEDLIGSLQQTRVLTSAQNAALLGLNGELNKAAHGITLRNEEAIRQWIILCSPRLFARLDDLIAASSVDQRTAS